jgi:hypothetical protein
VTGLLAIVQVSHSIEYSSGTGLSWTWWDMIQNLRRADQELSEVTDATRTEHGFHPAGMEK